MISCRLRRSSHGVVAHACVDALLCSQFGIYLRESHSSPRRGVVPLPVPYGADRYQCASYHGSDGGL